MTGPTHEQLATIHEARAEQAALNGDAASAATNTRLAARHRQAAAYQTK